jgi:Conserved hypothetical protein 698
MLKTIGRLGPGIAVGLSLAAFAYFATKGTRVPSLLVALVLGMAASFVLAKPSFKPGNDMLAKPLLRIGVALMGFRITISDLQALGWQPLLIAICAAFGTLILGYLAGRALKLPRATAFLTATSVAICGASAALAIATVLARRPNSNTERDVVATVASITIIGTIAVVAYPAICHLLGWPMIPSAVFLGASIHEVGNTGSNDRQNDACGDDACGYFRAHHVVVLARPQRGRGRRTRGYSSTLSTRLCGCHCDCQYRLVDAFWYQGTVTDVEPVPDCFHGSPWRQYVHSRCDDIGATRGWCLVDSNLDYCGHIRGRRQHDDGSKWLNLEKAVFQRKFADFLSYLRRNFCIEVS